MQRLARDGLVQRPQEGPQRFIARVLEQRPELADTLAPLLQAYLAARYQSSNSEPGTLEALVQRFKPRRIKRAD